MPSHLSRESLLEQRAFGVFIFRAGLVALPLWALASGYLYLRSSTDSALIGTVLFLIVPVLTLAIGFALFVPAVNQLRSLYQIRSSGLLRRQHDMPMPAKPNTPGGNDVDDILRRMEQEF